MTYLSDMKYNKYRNIKTEIDGIRFDSKKEANRYAELRMMEIAGTIKDLELQPKFLICKGVKWNGKKQRDRFYISDFRYKDLEINLVVVEDVKGHKTDIYKLKRSLFLSQYPEYHFIET